MSDLNDITSELGGAYDAWKRGEKAKNAWRDKFFAAINEELNQHVAPQIIAEFPTDDEESALRQAQRQYLRHRVVSTAKVEGGYQIILEEDPELRPFSFVNKTDGRVYQRIISEGSLTLDDEGLKEEKPELWEAITEEVKTRELKPLDSLTPEQLEQLQPYLAMPKPQTRLAAPRLAKDEELDNDES